MVRLENVYDSGLVRPIWVILSQMAFAPCGLSADELCTFVCVFLLSTQSQVVWFYCQHYHHQGLFSHAALLST